MVMKASTHGENTVMGTQYSISVHVVKNKRTAHTTSYATAVHVYLILNAGTLYITLSKRYFSGGK